MKPSFAFSAKLGRTPRKGHPLGFTGTPLRDTVAFFAGTPLQKIKGHPLCPQDGLRAILRGVHGRRMRGRIGV